MHYNTGREKENIFRLHEVRAHVMPSNRLAAHYPIYNFRIRFARFCLPIRVYVVCVRIAIIGQSSASFYFHFRYYFQQH